MARKSKAVEAGTGDVFVDLGFADAGERKLRVQLAMQINELVADRRLTQAKAAILMGVRQPDVSAIVTGRTGKYSLDRLVRCLNRLGYSIDMVVQKKRRPRTAAAAA